MLKRFLTKRMLVFVLVLLAAWPPVAWMAARALSVEADLAHADAIVVFGGSATYVERTREAARLFHQGRAPKIILTNDGRRGGWSNELERNPFFIERAAQELQRAGVPAENIESLSPIVSSTYDEALLLRDYAQQRGLRSLLFVTSAYHSRRALWTIKRVFDGSGIEVGLMSPAAGWQTPRFATWWLHLKGWKMIGSEYVKLIYYRVRY